MKKRNMILGSTIVLAVLLVAGTMAWFTSNPAAVENTFKAGTVDIEVNENGFKNVTNVNPGDTHKKEVKVESLGSKDTYVRVKLTEKWEDLVEGVTTDGVATYVTGDDWVDGGDGYYYYKKIMIGGETTPLIEEVVFDGPKMGNDFQNATFKLEVKAEAVQASHYAFRDEWGITGDPLPVVPAPGVQEWKTK